MNYLPQNWRDFLIFIIPLTLNMTLFSKSPYLTAHIKIMKQAALKGFLKKQRASRTTATVKMKLFIFVVLVSRFYPLTKFTKKPNIDAMGVLNVFLEDYTYSEICAGDQINYCRTTAQLF